MSNTHFPDENYREVVQITNQENLEKEILRLKLRSKTLESEWESNNNHLRENFGDIIFRSAFNKIRQSGQIWNILSQMVLSQPIVMETIAKFRSRIVERIQQLFKRK